MREDKEIFRDFIKEKQEAMDLIYLKIKEALKSLGTIEDNQECMKAKLLMCQCLILTDLTFMSKEEVEHLKNI